MILPHRPPAALSPLTVRLGLVALALVAAPVQALDPLDSPSRDWLPKLSNKISKSPAPAASAAASAPAAAPEPNLPKDGAERLRQRLAGALAASEGKAGAAATPTLQIVNRGEPPAAARPASAGDAPRRRAPAAAQAEPAATRSVAFDPHSQPAAGVAARLAAVHRADAGPGQAGRSFDQINGQPGAPVHWSYDGPTGPQAWADLHPGFATCGQGRRQSPIDIRDGLKLQLEPIAFHYGPSSIRVFDNGHTVQVLVGAGNRIEVMGRSFELQHVQFRRPSEEYINGRRFDMSAHLVHRDLDGRQAVVAVLLSRGAAQPLVQTVWNNLPLEKGTDQPVASPVDLNALLPAARGYYAYMGSMTTPPCSEDVLWLVLKTPVEISAQQLAIFDRLYPMNARPLQATAGRMIKESD